MRIRFSFFNLEKNFIRIKLVFMLHLIAPNPIMIIPTVVIPETGILFILPYCNTG